MEKFKFKNKPQLTVTESKSNHENQKGGAWWNTKGTCDFPTVSQPTECAIIWLGTVQPVIDPTITVGCIK